ncbi:MULTISPECIES: ParB family protein [Pseudomonas]|uniref:ParB family protein n=1 Tax=Pseudomonas sp. NCIMB 10586 TaxID=2558872 RepID=UPI001C0A90ED|nr:MULTISPECIES: ParB family protein [Pseudomonas]VCU67823.1 chromosome partitioning protein ParB [Pseudomonas synxantha]
MAEQLQVPGFARGETSQAAMSDPIADTPMVVTLDQLQAYSLDPRITRNPRFEQLKASIRERGLDTPPSITRRPGEMCFMIRSGGNTRLAILGELWEETRNERFFRIPCLFHPWTARGEIVALTGHLAESELHSRLTFIERALGIEKSRELYEQELQRGLSQSELARLLCADGYPIQQSHISRMQEAVQFLLPAIPRILYGGLGRHQVERLATLRKAAERTWVQYAQDFGQEQRFSALFHEVLAMFDSEPECFLLSRLQDELVGQMAEQLAVDYDTLNLDISIAGNRQLALTQDLAAPEPLHDPVTLPSVAPIPVSTPQPQEQPSAPIVTERLAAIQNLLVEQADPQASVQPSVPVHTDGLYPINDLWRIDPSLDTPHRLRIHIAQFAREIANASGHENSLHTVEQGYGFLYSADRPAGTKDSLALLHALVTPNTAVEPHELLIQSGLQDEDLIKLFRLIRLARRLHQIETPGRAPC